MKNVTILFTIILLAFLSSCKEKQPVSPSNSNTNTYKTTSYMPCTKGSWWQYTGSKNFTLTCTGETTINGKKYAIVFNSTSLDTVFMLIDNNIIQTYNFFYFTYHLWYVLNSTDPTGTKYQVDDKIQNINTRFIFNLSQKNMTLTTDGKVYNKVIKLDCEIYFDESNNGNYQYYGSETYYFAQGIGLVKYESGDAQTTYSLANYQIN